MCTNYLGLHCFIILTIVKFKKEMKLFFLSEHSGFFYKTYKGT